MTSGEVIPGNRQRRAIVYGSLAVPIKKPDTDHTHKWTVYVRGYNGEDISYYVKRVTFKLHDSFAQPIRNVDEAPFEVNETGWGEFQIQIKITFQDPSQRPLAFNHNLRLHPTEDVGQLKTSKPVLSEFYDEIIFDPATDIMEEALKGKGAVSDPQHGPKYQELLEEEAKEIGQIDGVMASVRSQLEEAQRLLDAQAPTEPAPKKKK